MKKLLLQIAEKRGKYEKPMITVRAEFRMLAAVMEKPKMGEVYSLTPRRQTLVKKS